MVEEDELIREAALFGIDLTAYRSDAAETGLWPCHVQAAEALTAARTQWRTTGGLGSHVIGLDYHGARSAWELAGLTLSPQQFLELQVMEDAAVAYMNRRAS